MLEGYRCRKFYTMYFYIFTIVIKYINRFCPMAINYIASNINNNKQMPISR